MEFSLSWLKEYIDIDLTPDQLEATLTQLGLEVDAVEERRPSFENVVVGRVLSVLEHPNADKLTVATVTDGSEAFQVVCGAPNCREGMKTAFARVGAKFVDDEGKVFKVKKTKIRDVESLGMLCSEKELGLSDEHEGIIELSEEMIEGTDLAKFYSQQIFEVSITPNLGHCMSMIGIVRELAAVTGKPVKFPEMIFHEEESKPVKKMAKVSVADAEGCPRYACRVITDLQIGPSPVWMQQRLKSCGIRSINNIVDVTNYVLMELGHPLHAFDYDQLADHVICVRRAEEGECFTTLDEVERTLSAEDILICDGKQPVALGGIMGGLNSEVSDQTTTVLLEAAYFDRRAIRRTSKRLGLMTESSKRFERGCDPNNVTIALDRAASLLQEIARGSVAKGTIDVKKADFPEREITCRLSRVNDLLGLVLPLGEVENIFQRLGFQISSDGENVLTVSIPTYRHDLEREVDLIEEVARIYGYENIPSKTAHYQSSQLPHTPALLFKKEICTRLMSEGLQEFLTCDLIAPHQLDLVPESVVDRQSVIKVMNPTSVDQSILRPSLLPGLLQVVKYNIDNQNPNIAGFEIGRVHFKQQDQYKEQVMVGIVLSGQQAPYHWDQRNCAVDYFDIKGIIENLVQGLGVDDLSFERSQFPNLHDGRQAAVYVGDLQVGVSGEIHPTLLRQLDLSQKIFIAELHLHDLLRERTGDRRMEEIPIFPGSERDWTVTMLEETPVSKLFDAINQTSSNLLEKISLRGVYHSETLGPDRKNVTVRFQYRDRKKTISQERVDAEHERLLKETMELLSIL